MNPFIQRAFQPGMENVGARLTCWVTVRILRAIDAHPTLARNASRLQKQH